MPILHNIKIRVIHAYLPEIWHPRSKPDSPLKVVSHLYFFHRFFSVPHELSSCIYQTMYWLGVGKAFTSLLPCFNLQELTYQSINQSDAQDHRLQTCVFIYISRVKTQIFPRELPVPQTKECECKQTYMSLRCADKLLWIYTVYSET